MDTSDKSPIFKGRLFDLFLEDRTLPNGRRVSLEYVRHPGSVAIVPFLDERHILLIRQYRPVINKYIWEIPAGTLDRRERPIDCAHRELVEETGFRAKRLERLVCFYTTPGFITERICVYAAYGLRHVATNEDPPRPPRPPAKLARRARRARSRQNFALQNLAEEDEIIHVKSFDVNEIERMLRENLIQDAKSLVGLHTVLWLRS